MKNIFLVLTASSLWLSSSCLAVSQIDQLTITLHQIRVDGGRMLKYEAHLGRVPIRDAESDEIHGHMFFVYYRIPTNDAPRPITFLWNGGPGSNTASLHLESIGPKRFTHNAQLVDNAETALEFTDLVFVDAIGTGFSRPVKREYGAEFYQTRGDVMAFTEFIRAWRLLFDIEDAPLFILGESWGSHRAAGVAYGLEMRGVDVDGLILASGRTGLPVKGSDDEFASLQIVQMSRSALYHDKLTPILGANADVIQEQVRTWALETYLPALEQLETLTDDKREAIAEKLSLYSGLPIEQIDRSTLFITTRQFLDGLLRDEGKTLDTNDMRLIKGQQDLNREKRETINAYLRGDLRFHTALAYVGGGGTGDSMEVGYSPNEVPIRHVGEQWDYTKGFYTNPATPNELNASNAAAIARGEPPGGQDAPYTKQSLELNLDMAVLLVNGNYDSLRTCASTDHILNQLDPSLRKRIIFRCYEGGHMFYRDLATRQQFKTDLRALITSASGSR